MTMTAPAPTLLPVTYPPFVFRLFVPGKPRGKGNLSHQGVRADGSTFYSKYLQEEPDTKVWVQTIATHALSEKNRMIKANPHADLFPYNHPVTVTALFVAERYGKGTGPPINSQGLVAFADLDKLQRSLGDALSLTVRKDAKSRMAGIIKDDRLIVEWNTRKAYCDEVEGCNGPGVYFKITEFVRRTAKLGEYW